MQTLSSHHRLPGPLLSLLAVACALPAMRGLAQMSDAEVASRLAEMNRRAATQPGATAEPAAPPLVRHAGPVYYRIPLRGVVGETITAVTLDRALSDAARRRPSAVVLEFDSPGGLVREVDPLVQVILRHRKEMRVVVWVREALSAAAVSSLCVDEIYFQTSGTFGAATPFQFTPEGTAADVDEKMRSAWRARARSYAELGHHSPLLAEGMIDASPPIYGRLDVAQKILFPEWVADASTVKEPGRLLTLTAAEAVECGLARGLADSIEELGRSLGFAGWTECEGLGVALADWSDARVDAAKKEWGTVYDRFRLTVAQALSEDPANFTDLPLAKAEAVRLWNARSTRCAQTVSRAEVDLQRLQRLAAEHPYLPANSRAMKDDRESLVGMRSRLDAGRRALPEAPPPPPTYGR